MKIKFCCDNGANIHSKKVETFQPQDLGLTLQEWNAMEEEKRFELVMDWATEQLDYWYEVEE